MKNLFTSIFILVTVFFWCPLDAQADFSSQIASAKELESNNQFEKANEIYALILEPLWDQKDYVSYYNTRNSIAYNLLDINLFDEARAEIESCIAHFEKHYKGPFIIQYPKILHCAGNIFGDYQFYKDALHYYNRALKEYAKLEDEFERKKYTSFMYNNIGTVYKSKRIIDTALIYTLKALELKKEVLGDTHTSTLASLRNISRLYQDWGDLDKGIKIQLEVLEVLDSLDEEEELALCYSDLSELYQRKKDYKTSKEYISKSLEIFRNIYGNDHLKVAYCYHQMGNALETEQAHEASIDWYKRAKSLKRKYHGRPTLSEAYTTMNLGKAYNFIADQQEVLGASLEELNELRDQSELYYQETHQLFEQTVGTGHMKYIELWLSEGNCFLARGDTLRAHDVFQKAYQRAYEKGVEKSYDRSLSCLNLATTESNIDSALMLCQQGLWELSNDWEYVDFKGNPSPDQVFYDLWSLILMEQKSSLISAKLEKENIPFYLEEGIETVLASDALINDARSTFLTNSAKLDLAKDGHSIYGQGLNFVNLQNENQQLDLAFQFMEKSKGLVLLEALHSGNRLSNNLIPDSTSFKMKNLNEEISKLTVLQNQLNHSDSLLEVNAQIFDKETQLKTIYDQVKEDFPLIKKIDDQNLILDLNGLQSKLEHNEIVYEYFQDKLNLFILKISNSEATLYSKSISEFNQDLGGLLNLINDPNIALQKSNSKEIWDQFIDKSYRLFKILLPDFDQHSDILIIPDGQINYLPFELLITEKPTEENINYSNLEYLIKQAKVKYAFSSSLHFAEVSKERERGNGLLAIAPSYPMNENGFLASRNGFSSLRFVQEEARLVSQIMGGKSLLASEASKALFKAEAPNFNMLHLAMHAYTHEVDPLLSGLVFGDSSGEDDILYAYEMYNMDLNSDMVVLSACNTGLGQYSEGEGVMSLARAFRYAGVQDIVMSLWQANDEATKDIMTSFYKNLKTGLDKSDALRNAKIEYINSGANSFPHFWATFVLLGDDTPVTTPFKVWLPILAVFSIGLLLFLWWKRKASASV